MGILRNSKTSKNQPDQHKIFKNFFAVFFPKHLGDLIQNTLPLFWAHRKDFKIKKARIAPSLFIC